MAQKQEEVSRYEWLAAAVGAVVFLVLIGYFGREATRAEAGPPEIMARVDSVTKVGAGYLAHISATNSGASAATSIRIVGELTQDSAVIETADVTLDLLGRRSSASAGLLFTRDPAQHMLRVRPVSFLVP